MNKMILKTLKAVKARGFDINRETLDNVDHCISLIADAETPETPETPEGATAVNVATGTGDTGEAEAPEVTKEADPSPAIDIPAEKPTKKELEDMKYWEIRKKYKIPGEKKMKKDELIDMILAQ